MSLKLAFVSMHTSPATMPGSGDAGGMNVVERAAAEALGLLGHQVELITRRSSPDDPDRLQLAENVWLRHLDAGPQTVLPKSVIDSHITEFATGLAALGPYDLLHSHHWMSGVAALPLAKQRGIPHVQSFHSVAALPGASLDHGEPPESVARVPGERLVAQGSDQLVTISAAEARTVIERCGADPVKVSIISPGVDRELFRPLPPGETPVAEWERGYVFSAARLQPLKGPDLAISTLAELPPEIRPQLVIAGDTSADFVDYGKHLRRLAEELGIADQVSFIGPIARPTLAEWLRGARVVLVPSHSETFGLIALEAAASGVPVIAAAAGGLREAVAHGETGQLMDSRLPQDWGNALKRLLTTPGLTARMGVVARVHARRFDWGISAIRLDELYHKLIAGNQNA